LTLPLLFLVLLVSSHGVGHLSRFDGERHNQTARKQEETQKREGGRKKRKGGGVPKTKPKATAFKPNEMGWKCQKQEREEQR
jgi:hypothetical protein